MKCREKEADEEEIRRMIYSLQFQQEVYNGILLWMKSLSSDQAGGQGGSSDQETSSVQEGSLGSASSSSSLGSVPVQSIHTI